MPRFIPGAVDRSQNRISRRIGHAKTRSTARRQTRESTRGYNPNESHPLRFVFRTLSENLSATREEPTLSHSKHLLRIAGAACLALFLSGCIIAPAWGPGPYRHHQHWGY